MPEASPSRRGTLSGAGAREGSGRNSWRHMHVAADRAGCLRHDGDTSSLRHGGSQLPAPLGLKMDGHKQSERRTLSSNH